MAGPTPTLLAEIRAVPWKTVNLRRSGRIDLPLLQVTELGSVSNKFVLVDLDKCLQTSVLTRTTAKSRKRKTKRPADKCPPTALTMSGSLFFHYPTGGNRLPPPIAGRKWISFSSETR